MNLGDLVRSVWKWVALSVVAGLITGALSQVSTDRRAADDLRRTFISEQSSRLSAAILAGHVSLRLSPATFLVDRCRGNPLELDSSEPVVTGCETATVERLTEQQALRNEMLDHAFEINSSRAVAQATFSDPAVSNILGEMYSMVNAMRRLVSPTCPPDREPVVRNLRRLVLISNEHAQLLIDSVRRLDYDPVQCEVNPSILFFIAFNEVSDQVLGSMDGLTLAVNKSDIHGRDESLVGAFGSVVAELWWLMGLVLLVGAGLVLSTWVFSRRPKTTNLDMNLVNEAVAGALDFLKGRTPP